MATPQYKYRKTFTYEGKRYQIYGNTLDEVYEKKQKKLAALREETILYTGAMTVAQWTEKALEVYKVNVKNLDTMERRINKHILKKIGSFPIKKVTPLQCQEIMNAQAGMSFSHVTKVMQELKFIFESAVNNDIIKKNPAANVIRPVYSKGKRRSLTDHEKDHLLKLFAASDKYILFELMYYLGCRPGEAIALQGTDIGKDGLMHIRGTKTANADRYVPIPAELLRKISGTGPFEPIAKNNAGKPFDESSYDRRVASLKRDLNISMGARLYRNELIPPLPLAEDFVPYCLRHTYCTNLAKAGVDIRTAQKLMGHANISITADIYTHVDDSDIRKAADQISSFFAGNM